MPNATNFPRLFIQTDPGDRSSKIASWVQVDLTDEFLIKIHKLNKLLVEHQIHQITVKAKANWRLSAGWQLVNPFGAQDSWLDVWDGAFTIRSNVRRLYTRGHVPAEEASIHTTYSWGDTDEHDGDFSPDSEGHLYDRLYTAQGWYDPVAGEPDWEIAFAKLVEADLAEFGERPLRLHSFEQQDDMTSISSLWSSAGG